jgi:hypothetical protein
MQFHQYDEQNETEWIVRDAVGNTFYRLEHFRFKQDKGAVLRNGNGSSKPRDRQSAPRDTSRR